MFVLNEIHVRGVKLIEYHIWVRNIRKIIPKDHLRVLEEGPKIVGMAVPGRPKMTEQLMARRPVDAPLNGVADGVLTIGGKGILASHYSQRRRAVTPRRGCDNSSRVGVVGHVPARVLLPRLG